MSDMLSHIFSVPSMLEEMRETLRRQASELFTDAEMSGLRRIILTGCGNSLCVAMAAKHAFLQLTGLCVQVLDTMELARYTPIDNLSRSGVAVLVISNSGNVSRITELARRIRHTGGLCVAVTGNPASPSAQAASRVLEVRVPPFAFRPDVRSFGAALTALILLAVEIGKANGYLPAGCAESILKQVKQAPEMLEGQMVAMNAASLEGARHLAQCESIEAVGSGWDHATAWFVHTKVIAACGLPACATNAEDWFHLYYFGRKVERIGTVLVANSAAPSHSRDVELIGIAGDMGRPLVMIGDKAVTDKGVTIITPALSDGFLYPLIQHIPAALLAVHLSALIDEEYHRGATGPWSACNDCATLNRNEVILFD